MTPMAAPYSSDEFAAVTKLAWKTFRACKNGQDQYRKLAPNIRYGPSRQTACAILALTVLVIYTMRSKRSRKKQKTLGQSSTPAALTERRN